ncbi:MAG: Nucleotidyltransferase substrate binding protein, HI0074 family [candidate division TM6 bacterium GW2011_GWF2_36_6]|nr:MAG: Nucleotidyltransferase substrate binding protein, HI0074 family [candidate division TM6 bacterium GW2011_GWF2_36_6]
MEKITIALQNKGKKALDAIATLKMALDDMKSVDRIAQSAGECPKKIYKTFRDSLVQRFEYTFDLTWKYLGEYLKREGRKIEIETPKAIFRESLKTKHLSDDEVRLAIQMVDHRNLTTHGYDEQLIEYICEQISRYYTLLESILQRTAIHKYPK